MQAAQLGGFKPRADEAVRTGGERKAGAGVDFGKCARLACEHRDV